MTSVQPRSLITQMQDAVADCDDGSSEDGMMMLLSMPHDIPEVTFPEVRETRDEDTPVVISRRLTPANRPLQLLEAGRLGASSTEHLPSRRRYPTYVLPVRVSCRHSTLFRWTDCLDTPCRRSDCGRRRIVTPY